MPPIYAVLVYPAVELLQEVGRVTIAGSRLEVQLGSLWWQLDKDGVDEVVARKAPSSKQLGSIRKVAKLRLCSRLLILVQEAADEAEISAELRNDVVHQDWVLRGRDAMRPVGEVLFSSQDDLDGYLKEWDREAKDSRDWNRLPARRFDLVPSQTLDELRSVERRLAAAADRVGALTFAVASARETGHPAGWIRQ